MWQQAAPRIAFSFHWVVSPGQMSPRPILGSRGIPCLRPSNSLSKWPSKRLCTWTLPGPVPSRVPEGENTHGAPSGAGGRAEPLARVPPALGTEHPTAASHLQARVSTAAPAPLRSPPGPHYCSLSRAPTPSPSAPTTAAATPPARAAPHGHFLPTAARGQTCSPHHTQGNPNGRVRVLRKEDTLIESTSIYQAPAILQVRC